MKTILSEKHREANEMVPAWLLLEWLADPDRKPAAVAFTQGPLRDIAHAAEAAMLQRGSDDARRYREIRLTMVGSAGMEFGPPFVSADIAGTTTYTADGLDAALDAKSRAAGRL